jgi:hypothetical protein
VDLVDGWYHRYLGRHIDPIGRRDHVHALRHGTLAAVVEAAILSSPEYYLRNGNTPEGYVAALYRDVLGRRAGIHEFSRDVNHVLTCGRNEVALRVLALRSAPILVAPAPVVVTRPVVVEPVVVPAYRPAPRYYSPPPGISIRVGVR